MEKYIYVKSENAVRQQPTMEKPNSKKWIHLGTERGAEYYEADCKNYREHLSSLLTIPLSSKVDWEDGREVGPKDIELHCDYEYCGVFDHPDCEKKNCKNIYAVPLANENQSLPSEKILREDENGDPASDIVYCDHCKRHTEQTYGDKGMLCSGCGKENPFGNCSEEQFGAYLSRIVERIKARSMNDLNKYFDKKKDDARERFEDLAQLKSPLEERATPSTPNPNKPFIVANVRELLDRKDISFSRMVEMMNEMVEQWTTTHSHRASEDETDMKRLYDWIMDDKRSPAITAFTSGWLRNVAKEIEYRIAAKPVSLKVEFMDCWEGNKDIPEDHRWLANLRPIAAVTAPTKEQAFEEVMKSIRVMAMYQSGIKPASGTSKEDEQTKTK